MGLSGTAAAGFGCGGGGESSGFGNLSWFGGGNAISAAATGPDAIDISKASRSQRRLR